MANVVLLSSCCVTLASRHCGACTIASFGVLMVLYCVKRSRVTVLFLALPPILM
jgi:hypothetical protein